jgi:HEPN domain-containing protein
MDRAELQRLANLRSEDAAELLKAGRFEAAYYLCGYVTECALKACIAKETRQYEFPDKRKAEAVWVHHLSELLGLAGLKPVLDSASPELRTNWAVVKDWTEESRYEFHTESDARAIFDATMDPQNGVLEWLKQHW